MKKFLSHKVKNKVKDIKIKNKLSISLMLIISTLSINLLSIANESKKDILKMELKGGIGLAPFNFKTNYKFENNQKLKLGYNFNFEFLPYRTENNLLSLGVGVSSHIGNFIDDINGTPTEHIVYYNPLYIITRFNLISKLDNSNNTYNDLLYIPIKLGWSFNIGSNPKGSTLKLVSSLNNSSPYASIGIGTSYKMFYADINYNLFYVSPSIDKIYLQDTNIYHSISLNVGLRYTFNVERNHKNFIEVNKNVDVNPTIIVTPPKYEKVETKKCDDIKVEKPKEPIKENKVITKNVEKKVQGRNIVHFKFDYDYLQDKNELGIIKNTADYLNTLKYADVDIVGNTDSVGSQKYNLDLGFRRANYVKNKLNDFGINTDIVKINSITSNGEDKPIDTNKTVKGRANNRNAMIFYKGWFTQNEDVIK